MTQYVLISLISGLDQETFEDIIASIVIDAEVIFMEIHHIFSVSRIADEIQDFADLNFSYPKIIDIAVRVNMVCEKEFCNLGFKIIVVKCDLIYVKNVEYIYETRP